MYVIKTTFAVAEALINKDIEACAKKIEKFTKELQRVEEEYIRVKNLPWWSAEKFLNIVDPVEQLAFAKERANSDIKQCQYKIVSLTNKIQRLHDSVDGYVYVEVK